MSVLRRIAVDDADPQISWTGPWFSSKDHTEDLLNSGPPFLKTMHGIRGPGGFSLTYIGTNAAIWGALKPRNTTAGPDPIWKCSLDGVDIGRASQYPQVPVGNYPFCSALNVPQGNHTIQMEVLVSNNDYLWVDQIDYLPAPSVDISESWQTVMNSDQAFSFSPGWQDDRFGRYTTAPGAWLTYDFDGEAIIWGGFVPLIPGSSQGLAKYTIDGEEPAKQFSIPAGTQMYANQPFFNVTGLKPGPHRLVVTNIGGGNASPLGVSFIYTKRAKPKGGKNKGTLIGGIVGGIVAVLLLGILILLFIRRKRQREKEAKVSPVWGTVSGASSRVEVPSQHTGNQTNEGQKPPTPPVDQRTLMAVSQTSALNSDPRTSMAVSHTSGEKSDPRVSMAVSSSSGHGQAPQNVWPQPQHTTNPNPSFVRQASFPPPPNAAQALYAQSLPAYLSNSQGASASQPQMLPQGASASGPTPTWMPSQIPGQGPQQATSMQLLDGLRDGAAPNPYRRE